MDYDVPVIEKDPPGVGLAFSVTDGNASVLQGLDQVFFQGVQLAPALGTHDDKVIGEGRHVPYVQHDDVFGLLLRSDVYYLTRQFVGFQVAQPVM